MSQISLIIPVKIDWFNSEKYFFTDESVKRQIINSISDNLTDSDLESRLTKYTWYSSKSTFSFV